MPPTKKQRMKNPEECPKGHKIGTEGSFGFCTRTKCGRPRKAPKPPPEPDEEVFESADSSEESALATAETQDADDALALREEENAYQARMRRVGLSKTLAGKEAEEWADEFILSELPGSLAELAHQRRYSTSSRERAAAAMQFINSAGRGKKDAVVAGASPIIIMTGGAELVGPWKKVATPAPAQVVEGSVVTEEKFDAEE